MKRQKIEDPPRERWISAKSCNPQKWDGLFIFGLWWEVTSMVLDDWHVRSFRLTIGCSITLYLLHVCLPRIQSDLDS